MATLQQPRPVDLATQGLARLGLDRQAAVLIVGLGKTGFSVARFLARHGIRFAVTDTRADPPFADQLRESLPDAAVFLGAFQPAAFEAATHLIVSPGVPLASPLIQAAIRRGVPVLGDVDLFACMAQAPVLAVTGSNGKSTVTTLLGLMAQADGRETRVGGNLGTPMLDLLDAAADLYVLELSSFQLESSRILEHLAAYAKAKQHIFHGNGVQVLNRDDACVAAMAAPERTSVWFSLESPTADYRLGQVGDEEWLLAQGQALMPTRAVRLQGRHNLANALAALALGDAAGLSRTAMCRALETFTGLDHRAQWVAEAAGVTWINDSKATNVGACMAALAGMTRPVVLIAGGDGKGADFTVLRPVVADKVKATVLMGRDAPLLAQALGDIAPTVTVANMKQAVQAARGLAAAGDVVLLAPACASLDQYKDYQERGRMFADEVRGLSV
jgi:UDP-N-acetylmuramoylalanine--D-glutamate ligase